MLRCVTDSRAGKGRQALGVLAGGLILVAVFAVIVVGLSLIG